MSDAVAFSLRLVYTGCFAVACVSIVRCALANGRFLNFDVMIFLNYFFLSLCLLGACLGFVFAFLHV